MGNRETWRRAADYITLGDRETCRRAADYIAEHGWMQGSFTNSEGEVCILGALHRVTERCFSAEDLVGQYLFAQGLWSGVGSIAIYNDAPTTTKEDVILALKRAAEWEGEE